MVDALSRMGEEQNYTVLSCCVQDNPSSLLFYQERLVIPNNVALKLKVLHYLHDNPTAGHGGLTKTLHRAYNDVFWSGLKKNVRAFIQSQLVKLAS